MKLILTADVDNLGEKGASVQVKDGYARNFLLPKKLAEPWSAQAELKLAIQQRNVQQRNVQQSQAAHDQIFETIQALDQLRLEFFKKITTKGTLYGSVTANEIAHAIEQQTGFGVASSQIALDAPIKQLGESNVEIHFENRHSAKIKVLVSPIETN